MNTTTAPASPVHAPSTSTSSGLFGRKSHRNLLLALVGIFVVLPLMIAVVVGVVPGL